MCDIILDWMSKE